MEKEKEVSRSGRRDGQESGENSFLKGWGRSFPVPERGPEVVSRLSCAEGGNTEETKQLTTF